VWLAFGSDDLERNTVACALGDGVVVQMFDLTRTLSFREMLNRLTAVRLRESVCHRREPTMTGSS
jgi:hypothetical protein